MDEAKALLRCVSATVRPTTLLVLHDGSPAEPDDVETLPFVRKCLKPLEIFMVEYICRFPLHPGNSSLAFAIAKELKPASMRSVTRSVTTTRHGGTLPRAREGQKGSSLLG